MMPTITILLISVLVSVAVGAVVWGYEEWGVLQEEIRYHRMRREKGMPDRVTVYRYQEVVRAS